LPLTGAVNHTVGEYGRKEIRMLAAMTFYEAKVESAVASIAPALSCVALPEIADSV